MEKDQVQRFPQVPKTNILISRDRIRIIPLIILCIIILSGSIWGLLLSNFTFKEFYMDPSYFFILLANLFVYLLLIGVITKHVFIKDFALIISSEGINIQKMPIPIIDDIFIPWDEIEVISSRRSFLNTSLVIRLKNPKKYMLRINYWKRFIMLIQTLNGVYINIPQLYLKEPINEIIQQISLVYTSELNKYNIYLHI